MIKADGDWIRGWEVEGKDSQRIRAGCSATGSRPITHDGASPRTGPMPIARRFIDTTTAVALARVLRPGTSAHPHGEPALENGVAAVRFRESSNLVTGCETGHDAAVPFVHYFEGMLSLGPYRVPDSGRDMQRIWTEVPEAVAKFQLGHRYRLPLWELVFHDCVVSQWYWGDYNNKLPALWDKRDLFNALYGTPPMFMFNRALGGRIEHALSRVIETVCPTVRAVGLF